MAATAGADSCRAEAAPKASTRRSLWADLLQRVFEVNAPCCPRCGGRMRVLTAITEADVAKRILTCPNLATRAPPLAMSRPGSQIPTWPELEPPSAGRTGDLWSAFEFDQSTPAEWDVGA